MRQKKAYIFWRAQVTMNERSTTHGLIKLESFVQNISSSYASLGFHGFFYFNLRGLYDERW